LTVETFHLLFKQLHEARGPVICAEIESFSELAPIKLDHRVLALEFHSAWSEFEPRRFEKLQNELILQFFVSFDGNTRKCWELWWHRIEDTVSRDFCDPLAHLPGPLPDKVCLMPFSWTSSSSA
jgi:hypothetical protein